MTLTSGEPVVMVFGFIIVCLITSTIALSLADIASEFPYIKGGLIEYTAIQIATGYAPQRWITVPIHIIIPTLFGAINAYNINFDMISAPSMSHFWDSRRVHSQ
ncbi:hypothetical protein BGW39_011027 [Mortierella sp. 14UC]|nr:hypothetical protein BGW39_011027 [Mortierella sp. 14UC]